MSKSFLDSKPILLFLNLMAEKQKMEVILSTERDGLDIFFKARTKVRKGNYKKAVDFHLSLVHANDLSCYLVHEFEFSPADEECSLVDLKVLPGNTFLNHYYKRRAYRSDFKKPNCFVWRIETPKNLQSMLEEYDKLARMTGKIPLFTT